MLRIETTPLLGDDAETAAAACSVRVVGAGDSPVDGGQVAASRGSMSASNASAMARARHGSSSDEQNRHSYTDLHQLSKETAAIAHDDVPTKNELGTVNGVYVPCLLNIIGVILFLRLGWGIGQAGVEGMFLIFVMAETQAMLTVLSASTIASNGDMKGGGSYFLVSRSLGPEIGGAIGAQFYFLYAVGIALYLVGFAEEAQRTWFPAPALGKRVVVVLFATGALSILLLIGITGARMFAKVNRYFFALQFACVAVGALFIYITKPHDLESGGEFTGVSGSTFVSNLHPHYTAEQAVCGEGERCTFAGVYAIVFPLATGFMEGLNLSGDLKNPGRSIPVGTLSAVGTACSIYIFLILTFAAAFTGPTLRNNFTFFQETSKFPFVVIMGVMISCVSSALGALFGASRILQAIARDDIFPVLKKLSQGSVKGDEPQYAVVFTALLAQIFICIGDLDVIAPICTCFFCVAYAGVNLTCFLMQVTGVPNFRPTFRFHSWHLSLLGVVLNLAVMIYLNAVYAVISLLVLASLFAYLCATTAPTNWGDISQALMFHQVRKYLLRLDTRKAHSKFWRPSLLLLTKDIACSQAQLCHCLKKGGLYVIGRVVVDEFSLRSRAICSQMYNHWLGHIFDAKMKAIPQVVVATHAREGYRMLMQTAGLGGMEINTVVVPWVSQGWDPMHPLVGGNDANLLDFETASEYVGLLADAIIIKGNVVLLCNTDQLDPQFLRRPMSNKEAASTHQQAPSLPQRKPVATIDVWITGSWNSPDVSSSTALMLQLAYVLHSNKEWKCKTRLRLIKLCAFSTPSMLQQERQRLEQTAQTLRIDVCVDEFVAVPTPASTAITLNEEDASPMSLSMSMRDLAALVQRISAHAVQIVLPLPDPRAAMHDEQSALAFLTDLDVLTANLPSTMLVYCDAQASAPVISTSI